MSGPFEDAFGYWLAGLIAGDGCFHLSASTKASTAGWVVCKPTFRLSLRDDDEPILREIAERTGIGTIERQRPAQGAWGGVLAWCVRSRDDVAIFVEILDKYPIRARKAEDYAIWREAVEVWLSEVRKGGGAASYAVGNRRAWEKLDAIRQRLVEVRKYRIVEVSR